eukprot:TRINITY_DN76_c5_g1_i3.p1 TRINITY_DN76_c5_g1~~TRINITY_DN76_c5_g1_i3.p1  ORF type:complete len:137 (+),score=27.85 TRINITY_DN76_c5_g1_i3:48-458(+)
MSFFKKLFQASAEASEVAMNVAANSQGAILNARSEIVAFLNPENIKSVKPHTPSIKFGRKLEQVDTSSTAATPHVPMAQTTPTISDPVMTANATPAARGESGVLEWYELPARYRRTPIDDKEMDAINQGGADMIYN